MDTRLTEQEYQMLRDTNALFAADTDIAFPLVGTDTLQRGQSPVGIMALIQTGSDAYNLRTPASDNDYTAIVMPSERHILGFGDWEHWEPGPNDDVDMKAMSLKKFFRLAMQGNPNVIEMLHYRAEQYRWVSHQFEEILRWRELFMSRHVFHRFSGYARGQFQKMESGKKEGYMGRLRFEVVQQLGYDPKDASHLIRLLIAGRDLAEEGTLRPYLEGQARDLVLDVKQGRMSLPAIKSLASRMDEENERLFHSPRCPLAAEPDHRRIEDMLILLQREFVLNT